MKRVQLRAKLKMSIISHVRDRGPVPASSSGLGDVGHYDSRDQAVQKGDMLNETFWRTWSCTANRNVKKRLEDFGGGRTRTTASRR
jgi:hypothetical protein